MASSGKNNEDALPKVIICGMTENNIPKLIVCDDKKSEDRTCNAPCNRKEKERSPREPPGANLAQKLQEMQQKLATGNAGLSMMRDRLQCDLFQKNQKIENLQNQLCSLQCEMQQIALQNAILNERIQQATCNKTTPSDKQIPCGKNYACLESRLNEYTENTKCLEKQLADMESHMEKMKTVLSKVQAERANMEKNKKTLMLCPPPLTCPPPGYCPQPPVCPPLFCPSTACPPTSCLPPSCPASSCPPLSCPASTCLPPSCPPSSCLFPSCPPPSCPPPSCPPPSCPPTPSCCQKKPRPCSFQRFSSDQQLTDIKEQCFKLKDDFQLETTQMFKKIRQHLSNLVK